MNCFAGSNQGAAAAGKASNLSLEAAIATAAAAAADPDNIKPLSCELDWLVHTVESSAAL